MYSITGDVRRITNWAEYTEALKDNLTPNRPSFEIQEGGMYSLPRVPEGFEKSSLAPYSFTAEDGTPRQEMRYVPEAAAAITNDAKKYVASAIEGDQGYQASTKKYNDGMAQLMLNTPLGDYNAIRSMEKLFDPSGVIRTSDVENIKASLGGGIRSIIENLLYKMETFGRSVELSPYERDQLAYAMNKVFHARRRYLKGLLSSAKSEYNGQQYQPWDSVLRKNNGWDYDSEVISAKAIEDKLASPKWEDGRPLDEVYEYTYSEEQLTGNRPALGTEEDMSNERDSRIKKREEDANRLLGL